MPHPFTEDEELSPEIKEKVAAIGKESSEAATVDLNEPDDDDDAPEPGKQLTPKEIRSRERYNANKAEAEENKRKAAELEVRLRETEARAARAEGAALAIQHQQRTPQKDPIQEQIDAKEREFTRLHQLFEARKANATPEEIKEWQADATRIKNEQKKLEFAQFQRDSGGGQQQVDPDLAAKRAYLEANYSHVYAKKSYKAYADDAFDDLVKAGEDPRNFNTIKKALDLTVKHFQLNGRPAPTEGEKSKYRAMPAGRQAPEGGGGGGKMTLTPEMEKLAFARFGKQVGGDQAKANKMWAQRVGKRLVAE